MFGLSKTFSGLDISPDRIQAVRVRKGGGGLFRVEGYSEKRLPDGILTLSYSKDNIVDKRVFADLLASTLAGAGILKGDLSVSIPDQVVKTTFIDLKGAPSLRRDDILSFIKWRVRKSLPYEVEDAKIDYNIVRGGKGEGGTAIAAIVKKDIIGAYEDVISSLGLRPRHISTTSLNLTNLFVHAISRPADLFFIAVMEDFFTVMAIKDGVPLFHRAKGIDISDQRLLDEIIGSILFFKNENPGIAIDKGILFTVDMGREGVGDGLSESLGFQVETIKVEGLVEGPGGMDMEAFAPGIGAAVSESW